MKRRTPKLSVELWPYVVSFFIAVAALIHVALFGVYVHSPLRHGLTFAAMVFMAVGMARSKLMKVRRRRRELRIEKGLCRNCGYDLKGSLGPRCPECGTRRRTRMSDI